jgi:uncharacterized protein YndB with AHSA1/START domain
VDIDRNAPATASGEVTVSARPEAVWDVMAGIDGWPSWSPDIRAAKLEGPLAPGSVFRWKSGSASLTSVLRSVDRPRELAWTGSTKGIKAVHVFRFESHEDGTLVRSEESWTGLLASVFKGYSRKTLDRGIRNWLALLKAEVERQAAA